jgi:hypothetical protein
LVMLTLADDEMRGADDRGQSLSVARGTARANPNSVEAAAASLQPAGPGGKRRETGGWSEQGPVNRWWHVPGADVKRGIQVSRGEGGMVEA